MCCTNGPGHTRSAGQARIRARRRDQTYDESLCRVSCTVPSGSPGFHADTSSPRTHCMVLSYIDQDGKNGTIAWGLNFTVRSAISASKSSTNFVVGTWRANHKRILAECHQARGRDQDHERDEPRLVTRHEGTGASNTSRPHHSVAAAMA